MSIPLSTLLEKLESLAPLRYAEEWDNVGLLIDPRARGADLAVRRVMLCIDATPAVVEEAVNARIGCLVAYHPPLFRPQKRLSNADAPLLFAAARHGFAVYSPHTALDAVPEGINDWLVEALPVGAAQALTPYPEHDPNARFKLVVFVPRDHADRLRDALSEAGAGRIGAYSRCSFNITGEGTFFGEPGASPVVGQAGELERVDEERLEMVCSQRSLPAISATIARHHPYEEPAWDLYPLAPKPDERAGAGRLVTLEQETSLSDIVERFKSHLELPRLRVALSPAHRDGAYVRRVAICAGSGRSVFEKAPEAEVYVTGELGHHDVLALVNRGKSVVLAEHTHTERGYLPRFRERLLSATQNEAEVLLAESDREPLAWI
ncbi:MAG TPA: Nif3-like dinuclear metal center hexameric protein [Polyangiaceae bacterium]|nr:Nif3-like dinuclear metal center hexameric protein [Polyangiaceae bacterium]